ncbi:MAG: cytidine deaminase [Thiomicrorhabdus chilensis]|jgi:cytidine deaminase|uniref:cytidine deaminase n=1 Tax=Thiomicrorhabdus chilensis TaxID=63656 RepID=UPI00299F26F8|nr:cytidine deaminase [Thiomicrorhabdus chilensis]MDX1348587.1 cytidine deaminase [Thiomicrorhabdus chilensis]
MSKQFDTLLSMAKVAAAKAYAPYSNFQVGAAIHTKNGQTFMGCNVENASYGMAICAERNAITTAVTESVQPGEIDELVLYIDRPELFSPCGACRQVISEFMKPDAKVTACNKNGETKTWTVQGLLPDGFSMPED